MRTLTILLAAGCTALIGCAQSEPGKPAATSAYLLAEEPSGAASVVAVNKEAEIDKDVVVVGRIGGEVDPWVEGVAAFSIVDTKLTPCSEREGDSCSTPWDYCCDLNVLPESTLLVKVVDKQGKPVAQSARELLEVKELQTVVVQGKLHRNGGGKVSLLATGVFVRP